VTTIYCRAGKVLWQDDRPTMRESAAWDDDMIEQLCAKHYATNRTRSALIATLAYVREALR